MSTSRPAPPAAGSQVVFDDAILAQRARTTLAGADGGMLSTGAPWARATAAIPIGVRDDDGEPLLCDPPDSVVQAADRRQLATLRLAPHPTFGVWLALHGRLHRVRSAHGLIVARLSVSRVDVGCPYREEAPDSGRRPFQLLALEKYALARPDLIAAHAPRLMRHVNERHHEQLRRLGAAVSGVPAEHLLGASLTALSSEAAQLCCIDGDGASTITLPFPAAAADLQQLSAALGTLVTSAFGRRRQ